MSDPIVTVNDGFLKNDLKNLLEKKVQDLDVALISGNINSPLPSQ